MKLTPVIFTLAFSGYLQAQNEQQEENAEAERSLWQQSNMLNQVLTTTFPEWRDAWTFIYRYGCYCHQAELKMPASRNGYHGPALDELDSLCRDSFRAQKCLENEYQAYLQNVGPQVHIYIKSRSARRLRRDALRVPACTQGHTVP